MTAGANAPPPMAYMKPIAAPPMATDPTASPPTDTPNPSATPPSANSTPVDRPPMVTRPHAKACDRHCANGHVADGDDAPRNPWSHRHRVHSETHVNERPVAEGRGRSVLEPDHPAVLGAGPANEARRLVRDTFPADTLLANRAHANSCGAIVDEAVHGVSLSAGGDGSMHGQEGVEQHTERAKRLPSPLRPKSQKDDVTRIKRHIERRGFTR